MYFLKLYYKFLDWEWYKDANVMRLFIHCLLKANRFDKKWQGIEIKAGSFVTSYENLAFELDLTVQQTRTAIKKLILTGEITNKTTSRYSIITVKNWKDYQADNKQNNKQTTNNQQADNKQITTTREYKSIESNKSTYDTTCINTCVTKGVVGGKNKPMDPYTNPLIDFYKNEYFKIFGKKAYLTAIERNKLIELNSDIEDFKATIPVALQKMQEIDFDFENWNPSSSWLLKDNNYTAVLNGTYDKKQSEREKILAELRSRQNDEN